MTGLVTDLSTKLAILNNLSDLNNVVTARTNLGLGTLATQAGTFSGTSSGVNTGDVAVATTTDIATGTDNVKTISSLGLVNAGVLKQSQTNIYAVASGTNTYAVTLTPAITTLTAGLTINVLFTNANTTAITVNVNGLGAIAVTKDNITPLVVGDIRAGVIYTMTYDGTRFQCDCGEAFLNSPSFTGLPLAPTASALTNNTQIATTAYTDTALSTFKTANFLDATSSIQTQINSKNPIGTKTNGGDAAYSVLANDNVVVTGTALTLPRIWTMPSAASVNAGNEKVISDSTGTITTTNTITIAVQTGQYLNNVLNGTEVMTSPNAHRRLFSDGVNNWFFDAGIVRLGATQTLTNKTLVTPVIGSITGVSGVTGLTVVTNNTASGAIARGNNLTPTLIASANNDVLVGLDIQPTFTPGAFTGVTNYGMRLVSGSLKLNQGSIDIAATSGNFYSAIVINSARGITPQTSAININSPTSAVNNNIYSATRPANTAFNAITHYVGTDNQIYWDSGNAPYNWTTSGTQKMQLLANGNFILQNGGTFTDAGYRLDIQGTLRATGQVSITTVGSGISIKEGTNAKMGLATMVAGTVTVANTSVTANSRIFLTIQSLGTVTVPMAIGVTVKTVGTSFVITSANVTDSSIIAWEIKEAL